MTGDRCRARSVFPFLELIGFPCVGVLVSEHLGVAIGSWGGG